MITRVVAIDDDKLYLELLNEFTKLFELDFIGFTSFSEFDLNTLTHSDLLLVDIYMPNDDGLDVLMSVGKSGFTGNVAIMSGATSDILDSVANLVESLNVNLCGKLSKPFKVSDFKSLISVKPKNISTQLQMTAESAALFPKIFKKRSIREWFEKGYLYPVFQPQVNSRTGELVGFECLSRADHPELGFISPALFIRLIESAELIDIYTLHFVDQSLNKVSKFIKDRPYLSCSFNVSANNLNVTFVDQLVSLIKRYGISTSQITIEVTETSAVSMSQEALYAISRLKISGIALAIDDFGTGYSAIKQLVELPFDELKIDRSFITGLESNDTLQAIVNTTIDLAKSLKYKLIIEGIETGDQLAFLHEKSDFIAQGYLFSKPLALNELLKFGTNKYTSQKN